MHDCKTEVSLGMDHQLNFLDGIRKVLFWFVLKVGPFVIKIAIKKGLILY